MLMPVKKARMATSAQYIFVDIEVVVMMRNYTRLLRQFQNRINDQFGGIQVDVMAAAVCQDKVSRR